MTIPQDELLKLCETITDMTFNNRHIHARIEIAKTLHLDDYLEVYLAIQKIQNFECYLPIGVNNYCYGELEKRFFAEVDKHLTHQQVIELRLSL